ncbi:hypothetical protein STEG23_027490 [Scotinomys teguina]
MRTHAPTLHVVLTLPGLTALDPLAAAAVFESFTALHCAPCDWQQLCRAALSGGDYLLWRSEFREICQQIANQNATAGFPGRNLDMLTGTGKYADLAAQIWYDPTVYAQISATSTRAWKALPNKPRGSNRLKLFKGRQNLFQSLWTAYFS